VGDLLDLVTSGRPPETGDLLVPRPVTVMSVCPDPCSDRDSGAAWSGADRVVADPEPLARSHRGLALAVEAGCFIDLGWLEPPRADLHAVPSEVGDHGRAWTPNRAANSGAVAPAS
jgi:hypothetical protein